MMPRTQAVLGMLCTPEDADDRATTMADWRTALCIAIGVPLDLIDPATGHDLTNVPTGADLPVPVRAKFGARAASSCKGAGTVNVSTREPSAAVPLRPALPRHPAMRSPVETQTSVQSGDALREQGWELHGPAAPARAPRRLAGAGRTS